MVEESFHNLRPLSTVVTEAPGTRSGTMAPWRKQRLPLRRIETCTRLLGLLVGRRALSRNSHHIRSCDLFCRNRISHLPLQSSSRGRSLPHTTHHTTRIARWQTERIRNCTRARESGHAPRPADKAPVSTAQETADSSLHLANFLRSLPFPCNKADIGDL